MNAETHAETHADTHAEANAVPARESSPSSDQRRRGLPSWVRTLGPALLVAAGAAALAAAARYRWVEPQEWSLLCDPVPWQPGCVWRSLVIQSFIDQRLAWVALGLALAAGLLRLRWLAAVALAAGTAGLVLYCAGLAAPAALSALLVFSRLTKPVGPR